MLLYLVVAAVAVLVVGGALLRRLPRKPDPGFAILRAGEKLGGRTQYHREGYVHTLSLHEAEIDLNLDHDETNPRVHSAIKHDAPPNAARVHLSLGGPHDELFDNRGFARLPEREAPPELMVRLRSDDAELALDLVRAFATELEKLRVELVADQLDVAIDRGVELAFIAYHTPNDPTTALEHFARATADIARWKKNRAG